MAKPTILWADLTINGSSTELQEQFAQHCHLRLADPRTAGKRRERGGAPNFGCLEYDYPDKRGLAMLKQIKREHPSVPVIVITLAHSEDLAIWAFRAGAWDYLTKPVSAADVERVCKRMQGLIESKLSETRRMPALCDSAPPVETQYVAKSSLEQSLDPAIRYVRSNYAEKVSEKHVAHACGMSTFRFSRAFRECYGMTFRESLLQHRVEASRRLLKNPELTITQVAFMSGFGDSSHFGKMFRRFYGQTATEYRAEIEATRSEDAKRVEWPAPTEEDLLAQTHSVPIYAPGPEILDPAKREN